MSSNRVQESSIATSVHPPYELSWTSLLTQAPPRVIFLIFSNSESHECSCACSVQRGALMVIIPPFVTCHFVLLVSMMHYTTQLTSFLHHSMRYDSLFCQPPVDKSPLTKTPPSPIRISNRVPIQPNCPKQARSIRK